MSAPGAGPPLDGEWLLSPRSSPVSAVDVASIEGQGALVVTGGADGEVALDAGAPGGAVRLADPTGNAVLAVRLVAAADGPLVVAADEDGELLWWHVPSGQRVLGPAGPPGEHVSCLAAAGAGVVAGTASGLVLRLPLPEGPGRAMRWPDPPDPLPARGPVTALAVHDAPDGLLLVAGTDTGHVHCWDGLDGRPRCTPIEVGQSVTALAVVRSGTGHGVVMVGCRDGSIRAWRADGRRVGLPMAEHETAITGLAALRHPTQPDVLVSADRSGTVCRWDPAQGELLAPPDDGLTSLDLATAMAATATSATQGVVAAVGDGLLMVRRIAPWHRPVPGWEQLWPPPLRDRPSTRSTWRDVVATAVAAAVPLLAVAGVAAVAAMAGRWGTAERSPGGLVQFVLLCGVASMVTVETGKRLLPVRAVYHRAQLRRWLLRRLGADGGARAAAQLAALLDPGPGRRPRWRRFLAGDVVSSVLNLPLEQFLAQLALAVERAFSAPDANADLLRAFAPATTHLDRLWATGAADGGDVQGQLAAAVDQLQAWLGSRWQFHLRLTAWWLSGAIGAALVAGGRIPQVATGDHALAALAFGGFVAWLSRDLVAVLEQARR